MSLSWEWSEHKCTNLLTTSCVVSQWLPSTGQCVAEKAHFLQNVCPHFILITGSKYSRPQIGHLKWLVSSSASTKGGDLVYSEISIEIVLNFRNYWGFFSFTKWKYISSSSKYSFKGDNFRIVYSKYHKWKFKN
jgi:hypothetical protein